MTIEEPYDDCGENLRSLNGAETCSLALTTTLHENPLPIMPDDKHSDLCDGLTIFILHGPPRTPGMEILHTMSLQRMTELQQTSSSQD